MKKFYYSKLQDVLIEMPDIEMSSGTGCVFDNYNYSTIKNLSEGSEK